MQIDLLCLHLTDFMRKHRIPRDLDSRMKKLKREVEELEDAIAGGDVKEIVKEASDVAIVTFDMLLILGAQPLWAMYLKLNEVAARDEYKRIAQRED